MTDLGEGFDFVVVGAGTAGCALAARLSEDPGHNVCLIEAGGCGSSLVRTRSGSDRIGAALSSHQLALPVGAATTAQRPPHSRAPGARSRRLRPDQRHGLFPRPPARLRRLGESGCDRAGATAKCCLTSARAKTTRILALPPFHGRGGPMRIRTVTRPNPLNFAFFNALAGLGITAREDLNGADSEGIGSATGRDSGRHP